MRVDNAVHASHPWVMNRIAPDFALLDAWDLPVEGTREDFDDFLATVVAFDPASAASLPTRALFRLRFRLGELLHWDHPGTARSIPGCTETTLESRLPAHLKGSAATPKPVDGHGFVPLYRTDDEWAGEVANATVHGVLQLCWVAQPGGRHRGRLGVYVKPRGLLGRAYLAAIAPFRHLVVYPALLRQFGRAWQDRRSSTESAGHDGSVTLATTPAWSEGCGSSSPVMKSLGADGTAALRTSTRSMRSDGVDGVNGSSV